MFELVGRKVLIKPEKSLEYFDKQQILHRPDGYVAEGRIGYAIIGKVEQVGGVVQAEIDEGKWGFKVGDIIICQRYIGSQLETEDGEEYRVIRPEDVECVVKE